MNKLDKKWCGTLSSKKFAVLYHDEIVTMQQFDPNPWIDPRCLEQAHALYECIVSWPVTVQHDMYRWLWSKQ